VIRCEHCGSTLPDGAIFCGECGRAVTAAASRRPAAPAPAEQAPPPPLQQPGPGGRRTDPAADAWLPEATLDPATRAWLTGADRPGPAQPVPVETPDAFAPRTAPTHVHGAGSGVADWTSGAAPVPAEPSLDPDAFPAGGPESFDGVDDPEVTLLAPRGGRGSEDADRGSVAGTQEPSGHGPSAAGAVDPSRDPDTDDGVPAGAGQVAPDGPRTGPADADVPQTAPVWAPPAQEAPPVAPSAPSWWVGRGGAKATPEPPTDRQPVSSPAQPGDTAVVEPLVDRRPPRPTPLVAPGAHATECHVCGHRLEPDDIFCAECGSVRPAVTAAFTGPIVPLPVARPDWAAEDTGDEDTDDEARGDDQDGAAPGSTGEDSIDQDAPDQDRAAQDPTAEDDSEAGRTADDDGAQDGNPQVDDAQDGDVRDDVAGDRTGQAGAPGDGGATGSDVATVHVPSGQTGRAADGEGPRVTGSDASSSTSDDDGALSRAARRRRGAHAAPDSATPPPFVPPVPGSATVPSSAPTVERSVAVPTAAPLPPLPPIPGATGPVLPLPGAVVAPTSADPDLDEDVDETRIVSRTPTRAPFLLHFSTGERLGVHGTALLGRLPRPQEGERFDDLLTIHDPGKSVSKTHLELGRDGDDLWVSDRFSGNGTVVRHIDGSIRRCEPGRRYRVERGARVDIGEQFFLVQ